MWGRLETCGRLSIGLPGNRASPQGVYEPEFGLCCPDVGQAILRPHGGAPAAISFGVTAAMADKAMQQRAAEDLIGGRGFWAETTRTRYSECPKSKHRLKPVLPRWPGRRRWQGWRNAARIIADFIRRLPHRDLAALRGQAQ